MKQLIRVVALILALVLLTSCGNLSDPKEDSPGASTEAPAVNVSDPITTMPTETVPAETAEPATTATIPIEAIPEETIAPAEPSAAQNPVTAAGFDAVYADICRLLDTGSWELEYAYANMGMMEVVGVQSTKEERYSSITYALEDINNDDLLEMIVLDAMGNTRILAIYAIQDGQPVMTHEGWYRARLYKLSDGALFSESSNGAAYSIFEAYGQRWFTYPKDDDQMEVGFYHAADGSYDPATAQEITADEYNAKQKELAQKITAFSVYNFS